MIRWLDHTADVSFEVICGTYEGVFAEFVAGLTSLLVSGKASPRKSREITLEEPTPADLLVALGRQVLLLFETERFVPARFEPASATDSRLKGQLWGEPFDPERMEYHLEIKGVTYHGLRVWAEGGTWRARVTFDV